MYSVLVYKVLYTCFSLAPLIELIASSYNKVSVLPGILLISSSYFDSTLAIQFKAHFFNQH